MKIAIIGAGISGLTAAFLLDQKHEIVLFEKNNYIGGHTHTIPVMLNNQSRWVDTGFIVCNKKNYPNFFTLLSKLQVSYQPTTMSFSVYDKGHRFEYNGTNLNTLFSQRQNLFNFKFIKMLKEIIRFNQEAKILLEKEDQYLSLADFLKEKRFSNYFQHYYLIPMISAIWSAVPNNVNDFPSYFLFQFLENHGMLNIQNRPQWYSIKGGSHSYVKKMIETFQGTIRKGNPVVSVTTRPTEVDVVTQDSEETFDKVIFANHSDEVLKVLRKPTDQQNNVLKAFPYQNNTAIVHSDHSIMPSLRRTWAAWNYHIGPSSGPTQVTYYMNALQNLTDFPDVFVSLNMRDAIDQNKIVQELTYSHPIYTLAGFQAQKKQLELDSNNQLYFCGAYWGNGFHEDGVNSALKVVRSIDEEIVCKMGFTLDS